MTRKDYILIADVLKLVRTHPDSHVPTVDSITWLLGDAFAKDNPRFDMCRFSARAWGELKNDTLPKK